MAADKNNTGKAKASTGLWAALEQFFGRAPKHQVEEQEPKYRNDELPGAKRKRRAPRKRRKTAAERKQDTEQAQQAVHSVLENTTLDNARALSQALRERRQESPLNEPSRVPQRSPDDPMRPVEGIPETPSKVPPARPRNPPVVPKGGLLPGSTVVPRDRPSEEGTTQTPSRGTSGRPRGPGGRFLPRMATPEFGPGVNPGAAAPTNDQAPPTGPWGGRGTHRIPKAQEWKLPPGPHLVHPKGIDSILPPKADKMVAAPEMSELEKWGEKLSKAFKGLWKSLDGGGSGGGTGGGGKAGKGIDRMMQFFGRMGTGGASNILQAGGAGGGGSGFVNAAAGGMARMGVGGIGGMGGMASMAAAAGPAGIAIAAVVGVAGAMILLKRTAEQFAEAQAESVKQFAPFNARIAGAVMKSNFAEKKRMFEQGAINSVSSDRLLQAVSSLKDELMPMRAAITDVMNVAATAIVTYLRDMHRVIILTNPLIAWHLHNIEQEARKTKEGARHNLTGFFRDVEKGVFNRKPGK